MVFLKYVDKKMNLKKKEGQLMLKTNQQRTKKKHAKFLSMQRFYVGFGFYNQKDHMPCLIIQNHINVISDAWSPLFLLLYVMYMEIDEKL